MNKLFHAMSALVRLIAGYIWVYLCDLIGYHKKVGDKRQAVHKLSAVPIMVLDRKNRNGHVWPKAVGEAVVRKINEGPVFGQVDYPVDEGDRRLEDVSHSVSNARIEGDRVICDVNILPTEAGKRLKREMDFVCTSFGQGRVFRVYGDGETKEGVVRNFELRAVDAIPRNIDAAIL